jgi:hypothetical protein
VLAPIELHADGAIAADSVRVWTGAEGIDARGSNNCKDWSSASNTDLGVGGWASFTGSDWFGGPNRTRVAATPCDNTNGLHLYCLQE